MQFIRCCRNVCRDWGSYFLSLYEQEECSACEPVVDGFCVSSFAQLGHTHSGSGVLWKERNCLSSGFPSQDRHGVKETVVGAGDPEISNMHDQDEDAERRKCTEDKRVGKV